MNFPDWAPKEVVSLWERYRKEEQDYLNGLVDAIIADGVESGESISREQASRIASNDIANRSAMSVASMLERLLTVSGEVAGMDYVWRQLEELPPKYRAGTSNSKGFAQACALAFYGPRGTQTLTNEERKTRLELIISTARGLAELVRHTEFDDYLWREHGARVVNHIVKNAFLAFDPERKPFADALVRGYEGPGLLSDTLDRFALEAPDMMLPKFTARKGPASNRLHFLLFIAHHLRGFHGVTLNDLVARTTSAAFPDLAALSAEDVSRKYNEWLRRSDA